MAIVAADILYKTSLQSAQGDSLPQATPGLSIGGTVSTTPITDAALNNLFPDITGDENAASNVDYQCFFIQNNHATLSLTSAVVYMSAEVAGGANCAIATDNLAPSPKGQLSGAGPQAINIANKNTAPVGVSAFSSPVTKAAGLAIGAIAPGFVKAIWVRRTATNSVALNNDGLTVTVAGDTAA